MNFLTGDRDASLNAFREAKTFDYSHLRVLSEEDAKLWLEEEGLEVNKKNLKRIRKQFEREQRRYAKDYDTYLNEFIAEYVDTISRRPSASDALQASPPRAPAP